MAPKRVSRKPIKKLIGLSRRELISILGLVILLACSTQILLSLNQSHAAADVNPSTSIGGSDGTNKAGFESKGFIEDSRLDKAN